MIFFYIFVLVGGISIAFGLDPKKWHTWLLTACGLVIGFLMGLMWADLNSAIAAGILFAFITLASGVSVYWNRQKWKGSLQDVDSKKYPLLAKWTNILKKIFHI